jgi:hypothetical protein
MSFSLYRALQNFKGDQPTANQRKENLEKTLKDKYNMTLRDDSRLAYHYATHEEKEGNVLDEVARDIWYARLLYTYSNYADVVRQRLPITKHKYMSGNEWFPLIEQRSWEHIQRFVLPMIQLEVMSKMIRGEVCTPE